METRTGEGSARERVREYERKHERGKIVYLFQPRPSPIFSRFCSLSSHPLGEIDGARVVEKREEGPARYPSVSLEKGTFRGSTITRTG